MTTIFLDEGIPLRLANALTRRKIRVIIFPKEWRSLDDQTMLLRAAAEGAKAVITQDKRIAFQTNLDRLPLSLIILSTNNTLRLLKAVDIITACCADSQSGRVVNLAIP